MGDSPTEHGPQAGAERSLSTWTAEGLTNSQAPAGQRVFLKRRRRIAGCQTRLLQQGLDNGVATKIVDKDRAHSKVVLYT